MLLYSPLLRIIELSSYYDSWAISRPDNVSMSLRDLDRGFERTDGLDRASSSLFAKKPLVFSRNHPTVRGKSMGRPSDNAPMQGRPSSRIWSDDLRRGRRKGR
jgi:hypothetical protein